MGEDIKQLIEMFLVFMKTEAKQTMDKIEERVRRLEVHESGRDQKIDTLVELVRDVKSKVELSLSEPGKRYNAITLVIITGIITSIINGTIGLMFLKISGKI